MKTYEIWRGFYSSGQGDHSLAPIHLGVVESVDFKTACMKYELINTLRYIENKELNNEPLYSVDYQWWYNADKIFNSWTGPYYENIEDAWKSFGDLEEKYRKNY